MGVHRFRWGGAQYGVRTCRCCRFAVGDAARATQARRPHRIPPLLQAIPISPSHHPIPSQQAQFPPSRTAGRALTWPIVHPRLAEWTTDAPGPRHRNWTGPLQRPSSSPSVASLWALGGSLVLFFLMLALLTLPSSARLQHRPAGEPTHRFLQAFQNGAGPVLSMSLHLLVMASLTLATPRLLRMRHAWP